MIINKSYVIVFTIIAVMFTASYEYVYKLENKISRYGYKEAKGKTSYTSNAKIIGAKVVGADMMWIKQVLDVGETIYRPERLLRNSEQITNLNPYFAGNYYFSATILAMIRIYNRYDMGMEILNTGIDYNPDDRYLKGYLGGIIAQTKGDYEELLRNFEKILSEKKDDTLLNVVAYIYEMKYKKTGNTLYIKKALYYWVQMLDAKEEIYRERAEKKIKEYSM